MKNYIPCDCHHEVLNLEHEKGEEEVYFSIYYYSAFRVPWNIRLRSIWRTLRIGYPYGDQLVLSKENTKELINTLQSYYDNMGEDK